MLRKRALVSVSDKTGLVDFAKILVDAGYEILSTGGTLKELQKANIKAISVEEVTEFPECFGGRVKTMHPKVMGGILFRRDISEHVAEAKKLGIEPIDLVVVNLYPFEKTAGDKSKTDAEIIEQIDIGGPTLLRSAAKNYHAVTVLCDPADYSRVASQIQKDGFTTPDLRAELAAKIFVHTANYDMHIAGYFGMNRWMFLTEGRKLRYGENPHQWGEYYKISDTSECWKQLQGKDLSYLNILDADAAWRMVLDFSEPTAVFVKHANPSGIASRPTIEEAFQHGYDTDRLSAFGVIIALNRPCTKEIVEKIIDQKIFTELLMAPSFDPEALDFLKQKPKIRVLALSPLPPLPRGEGERSSVTYRSALGGILVQDEDTKQVVEKDLTCVTKKKPTKEQIEDLLFAWKVVKHAKSNAIVLAKDLETVGIGCGQTSRVDSSWIAAKRAGERAKGSVLASDAFFPFPDALEEAAKHGVVAVIQPGGSIRDGDVTLKADELGLAMVVTGVRGFRH